MELIATCGPADDETSQKDAELIAAAPDLLEACKRAAEMMHRIAAAANQMPRKYAAAIYACDLGWGEVEAAIAKAEGSR
jgi:hypothetical protein